MLLDNAHPFSNKKGTETTSSNKMFLGVVHQQREVWALY